MLIERGFFHRMNKMEHRGALLGSTEVIHCLLAYVM
jgi:hypothetical protein